MNDVQYTELPDEACDSLLTELFQSIPELLQRLAPYDFSNSFLVYVFHPLPEQQYKEYRYSQLQLIRLQKMMKKPVSSDKTKTYEEFLKTIKLSPVEELYEIVSIFGDCLWNIFSNNHTVFNQQGESYDLGSWRGSGAFIAEVINRLKLVDGKSFDYMDFYMGGLLVQERADLTPVYEFIFRKLKAKQLDWEYSFPRMGLIEFSANSDKNIAPENYDATLAVQQQLEETQKEDETDRLRQKLYDAYDKEFDKARYAKPLPEVMAYYNVYGRWPQGHPLNEN